MASVDIAPATPAAVEKATAAGKEAASATTLKPSGAAWSKPSRPYAQDQAADDLPAVHHALVLFLESQMLESEAFIRANDERLCVHRMFSVRRC